MRIINPSKINIDWDKQVGNWNRLPVFSDFLRSHYMRKLITALIQVGNKKTIYPERIAVFKAFRLCPPEKLKVVILGQDPYPDGSAIGLAFGNYSDAKKWSRSLVKILDRVERDFNTLAIDEDPTLQMWAEQGVLLLNTALTVEAGKPNSHAKPWERFTRFVIKYIAQNFPGTIFMLWGKQAQTYEKIDDVDLTDSCIVLKAEHPAYAVRQGREWECDNFKQANEILIKMKSEDSIINW